MTTVRETHERIREWTGLITFARTLRKHKIEIKMLDEDGRLGSTVMNLDFEVKIPDYLLQVGQNFIVNIESLRLAKPGNYTWVVNYDRQRVTAIPLRALLLSDTPT